ncbi:2-C-methyl-D-erythritol 2,4-cyclodiphosphate synthase [Liberiplasma polymorphum]|uniref:2-C-methyl-D-erythritol 2,4-cyclodiphosphate synthase n=1 Tax=Liberiplasma polymorphum TaxID=3374570 RepID=UPI003771F531
MMIRIGHSTDIHQLRPGKSLVIGGLLIDSPLESVGHSDADCLLHSIAEALLGACALGDLGTFFPDNDPKYKGIDSKKILVFAYEKVKENGYKINNIDSMIFLETPKLRNYIDLIRENMAKILELDINQISVKATTGENIGIVGRSEAIVCETVLLIEK